MDQLDSYGNPCYSKIMKDDHKAKCFTALLDAACRLEELPGLQSAHLTFAPLGVKLTMFRVMPDGAMAHVEYLMAWEEIALTQFDLLDDLVTDVHAKLMAATPETLNQGPPDVS